MYFGLETVIRYYTGSSTSEDCMKPVIITKNTALLIQNTNFILLYRS